VATRAASTTFEVTAYFTSECPVDSPPLIHVVRFPRRRFVTSSVAGTNDPRLRGDRAVRQWVRPRNTDSWPVEDYPVGECTIQA
jgi:hypothetical protein